MTDPAAADLHTPVSEIEARLEGLARRKDAWLQTGPSERIRLLETVVAGVLREARGWAEAMSRLKGVSLAEPLHGEDWMYGPGATARCARLLIETLRAGGRPRPPMVEQRASGQWVARVFPATVIERTLGPGWRADVWIEPAKPPSQGRAFREPPAHGKVALVLGAGNVSAIPATDVLHKLFVDHQVAILKMHDVNAEAGPFIARAFQGLVDAGFLAVVYGGADTGAFLTAHALVDTIHITGSARTHDAIVWGATPDEQAANRRAGRPRLAKPITSELGGVSPVIVVPGDWSADDLRFHATSVAGMVTANAGFNCLAANCVLLHRSWPLREPFLDALEQALRDTPPRLAYYPGADRRYQDFLARTPNAHVVGEVRPGCVPWTVFRDVPPRRGAQVFTEEPFCGVVADTAIDAGGTEAFLDEAVRFCNDDVVGSLSCTVLVDSATRRRYAPAVDRAIDALRYGGIAVNGSTMFLFGLMSPTWGAFPGQTIDDVGSGLGVVHNTFLFDHPQKSVHTYPFRIRPKPLWFHDHRTLNVLGRDLTALEARPSLARLAPVALAALRA